MDTRHVSSSALLSAVILLHGCDTGPDEGNTGWEENWEAATEGFYEPGGTTPVNGSAGVWHVHDTVSGSSGCGETPHRAEVASEGLNRRVRLIAVDSGTGCADNVWIQTQDVSIPMKPGTSLSFYGEGEAEVLSGTFTAAIVWLALEIDTAGDGPAINLVYVIQHEPEGTPLSVPFGREFFLSDDGDSRWIVDDVFSDYSQVINAEPEGAIIRSVAFGLESPGSATIGTITISDAGGPSSRSSAIVPDGAGLTLALGF